MDRKVNIAIIGAGTAGLSAFQEASKFTSDILLIDKGPLGSTCARVGCMPSKVLLQAANDFHRRHYFSLQGIHGSENLHIDLPAVLAYVREMRDHFTAGVIRSIRSLKDQFICGEATFIEPSILQVGKEKIHAKSVIIATGSHSIIPTPWHHFKDKILTSETIFEQQTLAKKIAVIGGGSIGLEFGQALARLGIELDVYNGDSFIGGLSDPEVNKTAIEYFNQEFPLYLGKQVSLTEDKKDICVRGYHSSRVQQVIAAVGRKPNLSTLGLQNLGIELDAHGMPAFDKTTMKLTNHSIYMAGDVNHFRPLLHEAADEGRIAGFNAANRNQCFKRRTPLRILFTEPNIAVIGKGYNELPPDSFVIGEVSYSDQGRAKVMHQNHGLLRVYGSKEKGELLGAECIAPGGEHIGHLLAWAIEKKLTVFDALQMPFYHPVIEEGMRTALRQLSKQVTVKTSAFDLAMCDSEAIHSLS